MTTSINTRPLLTLRLATSPTQQVGVTTEGTLLIFPVTGGSFEGDRLRGTVLAGGGDWVSPRADGSLSLDLRVTLETDDGALIHMTFSGVRDDGIIISAPCRVSKPPRRSTRSSIVCLRSASERFVRMARFTSS